MPRLGRRLPAHTWLDFFVERAPATPPPQRHILSAISAAELGRSFNQ